MAVSAVVIHIIVLPHADLTLLAANFIVGLILASLLAVLIIGEKWSWRYDFPAFCLVVIGTTAIVITGVQQTNTHTAEEMIDLLLSATCLIFLAVCCVVVIMDHLLIKWMVAGL